MPQAQRSPRPASPPLLSPARHGDAKKGSCPGTRELSHHQMGAVVHRSVIIPPQPREHKPLPAALRRAQQRQQEPVPAILQAFPSSTSPPHTPPARGRPCSDMPTLSPRAGSSVPAGKKRAVTPPARRSGGSRAEVAPVPSPSSGRRAQCPAAFGSPRPLSHHTGAIVINGCIGPVCSPRPSPVALLRSTPSPQQYPKTASSGGRVAAAPAVSPLLRSSAPPRAAGQQKRAQEQRRATARVSAADDAADDWHRRRKEAERKAAVILGRCG